MPPCTRRSRRQGRRFPVDGDVCPLSMRSSQISCLWSGAIALAIRRHGGFLGRTRRGWNPRHFCQDRSGTVSAGSGASAGPTGNDANWAGSRRLSSPESSKKGYGAWAPRAVAQPPPPRALHRSGKWRHSDGQGAISPASDSCSASGRSRSVCRPKAARKASVVTNV